jgi:hypothetical protein
MGVAKQGMLKQGEGVHVVAVPRGFELRIAAALSDMGVGISTRSNNSINVGRLRVHASVKDSICSRTSARVSGVRSRVLC